MSDISEERDFSSIPVASPISVESRAVGDEDAEVKSQASVKCDQLGSKSFSFNSSKIGEESFIINGKEDDVAEEPKPISYKSMDTNQFLEYRQRTSNMFGIPSQFFQSRASLRTWGADKITDPSVQPISEESVVPHPFHVTLPGYHESQCENLIEKREDKKEKVRDPVLGPDLSHASLTWTPVFTPDSHFKQQAVGYNWNEQASFKMDKFPYVNAFFSPKDPEETNMYSQMLPWCAYPYGVPAVDEYADYYYEGNETEENAQTSFWSKNILCCSSNSTSASSSDKGEEGSDKGEECCSKKVKGEIKEKKTYYYLSDCCPGGLGRKLSDSELSKLNTNIQGKAKHQMTKSNSMISDLSKKLSDAFTSTKNKLSSF